MSFFAINRGDFSILIHPRTREELKDHTARAIWLGPPVPLKVEILP